MILYFSFSSNLNWVSFFLTRFQHLPIDHFQRNFGLTFIKIIARSFLKNWDSLNARRNSHYEAWSY